MKTFVLFKNSLFKVSLLLVVLFSASKGYSQTIAELVFQNPVLATGSAGQDGAQYRFSNVGPGIDAVVTILGRSSNAVSLTAIDTTTTGYNKAWQPTIKYTGTVAAHSSYSMDFRINFYQAGTNTKKTINFSATALDMDGDDNTLREWGTFKKIKPSSLSFAPVTSITGNLLGSILDLLNLDNNGDDEKLTGSLTNYPGIDTTATNLMSNFSYDSKDQIDITYGASTASSSVSNPERLNSVWFKTVTLVTLSTLPAKLVDFSATYNKSNVTLTWRSAQELNFNYYLLEHSTDGVAYSTTSLVFGAAQNGSGADYSYLDRSVAGRSGIIYYRLKMVDLDGKFTYSPVRIIRLGDQPQTLAITTYPNPVVSDVRVTLPSSWQNKNVSIDIYNSNGIKIKNLTTANSSQTETIAVSDLGRGVYFVKAACNGETAQQKIIKN